MAGSHLPDSKGLGVHDGGLNDLLGREHPPGDRIHVGGADVGDHVSRGVDGHVGDAGRGLQLGLQGAEVLRGGEELHVGLLVHIPAHGKVGTIHRCVKQCAQVLRGREELHVPLLVHIPACGKIVEALLLCQAACTSPHAKSVQSVLCVTNAIPVIHVLTFQPVIPCKSKPANLALRAAVLGATTQ